MKTETPEKVSDRVFHEDDMQPGAICRRYIQSDDTGSWEPEPWFIVISPPKESEHTYSEFVYAVHLTGENQGVMTKQYLSTLGVKPPHRGVTEKHEFEIPSKYIASSRHARGLLKLVDYITK